MPAPAILTPSHPFSPTATRSATVSAAPQRLPTVAAPESSRPGAPRSPGPITLRNRLLGRISAGNTRRKARSCGVRQAAASDSRYVHASTPAAAAPALSVLPGVTVRAALGPTVTDPPPGSPLRGDANQGCRSPFTTPLRVAATVTALPSKCPRVGCRTPARRRERTGDRPGRPARIPRRIPASDPRGRTDHRPGLWRVRQLPRRDDTPAVHAGHVGPPCLDNCRVNRADLR